MPPGYPPRFSDGRNTHNQAEGALSPLGAARTTAFSAVKRLKSTQRIRPVDNRARNTANKKTGAETNILRQSRRGS